MPITETDPKDETAAEPGPAIEALTSDPVERAAKASFAIIVRWVTLAFAAILFVGLSGGVLANSVTWLDAPVVRFVSSLRSEALTAVMRKITWCGNGEVLATVGTVSSIGLWFARYQRPALFMALSAAGSGLLNTLLKHLFARDRPPLLVRLANADGFAYPSGHAMAGAAIYGAIALIAILRFPRLKLVIPIAAGLLIVLIGFSRVYLGVHFPSDVLAGWALGLSWPLWLQPLLVAKSSTAERVKA